MALVERAISEVNASGALAHGPLPAQQTPNQITPGPDGNLWYTTDSFVCRATVILSDSSCQSLSDSSVGRILRGAMLQPQRQKMWITSHDEEFREKRDEAGLDTELANGVARVVGTGGAPAVQRSALAVEQTHVFHNRGNQDALPPERSHERIVDVDVGVLRVERKQATPVRRLPIASVAHDLGVYDRAARYLAGAIGASSSVCVGGRGNPALRF